MTGEQLATWRTYWQLTQAQLASQLGVTKTTVARWECGMRHIPPFLGLSLETIQRELPKGHQRKVREADPRSAA